MAQYPVEEPLMSSLLITFTAKWSRRATAETPHQLTLLSLAFALCAHISLPLRPLPNLPPTSSNPLPCFTYLSILTWLVPPWGPSRCTCFQLDRRETGVGAWTVEVGAGFLHLWSTDGKHLNEGYEAQGKHTCRGGECDKHVCLDVWMSAYQGLSSG